MLLTCHGYLVGPLHKEKAAKQRPLIDPVTGLGYLESIVLEVLQRNSPRPVAYDVLIIQLWPDGDGSLPNLARVVTRLRNKTPNLEIENVKSFGYRLE